MLTPKNKNKKIKTKTKHEVSLKHKLECIKCLRLSSDLYQSNLVLFSFYVFSVDPLGGGQLKVQLCSWVGACVSASVRPH